MWIIGIFPLKKAPSREDGVRFWTNVRSFCMAVAVRDRISTAGWAALSGYVDHACGNLASGQVGMCHETVEPRLYRRGSDRGEPDVELTPGPSANCTVGPLGTAIIGGFGTPRRITGLPAGHNSLFWFCNKPHKHWLDWINL